MFSSRSFIVSGLILKFFIYFAFILAYGVRYWFSFITLNYVFFPTVCSCLLCFRLIDYIRGFISELSAICLVCVCVCVYQKHTVLIIWLFVQFEIREHDTSKFVFYQDGCDYMEFSVALHIFQDCLFKFCEKRHWYFGRGYTESVDCFGLCSNFDNISSSYPRPPNILLNFLCVFFTFFYQCLQSFFYHFPYSFQSTGILLLQLNSRYFVF